MKETDGQPAQQRKLCMIGSFAVGKTSLVQRFVHSVFSGDYYTTVGVKIDRKVVEVDGQKMNFILWDLNGEDAFQSVQMSYLRGMHGYFLVVDGTRKSTVEVALQLDDRIQETFGNIPRICAVNKSDLKTDWEVDDQLLAAIAQPDRPVIQTSACNGDEVERMFLDMGRALLGDQE